MNPRLRISLTTLLLLTSGSGAAAAELSLRIHNVAVDGGNVMLEVVASKAAFRKEAPPVAAFILPASDTIVTVRTDALPAGDYAVRVMQDSNGNGTLDANLVGMPTEPWGFSNDARGSFGPPGWSDARFGLDADVVQDIRLNR